MIVGTSARFDALIQYVGRGQNSLNKLEAQISSGKVAESFADQPRTTSLISLKTVTASRDQYLTNISAADTRLSIAASALDSMSDIAEKMTELLLPTETDTVESRKTISTGYLQQMVSLLNAQSGDTYVFGGTDTDSPPVQFDHDPTDDAYWGQGGGYFTYPPPTAADAGKFDASAPYDGTNGYRVSYYKGGPGVTDDGTVAAGLKVRADRDVSVSVGFSAAEPAFESLMRGIHMIASLPSTVPNAGPPAFTDTDYQELVTAARKLIETGKNGIQEIQIRASSAQVTLNNAEQNHKEMLKVELPLISEIEDADPAEAMLKYQKASVQLQAMYQLSVRIQDLSLVNYLK